MGRPSVSSGKHGFNCDHPVPGQAHLAARTEVGYASAFGSGPEATPAAIRHLGYVQIDTIHVIERCHHHILFARIRNIAASTCIVRSL